MIAAQANPGHIGWIEESGLAGRYFQTGVSFLIGETGHVIAEPPRVHYAAAPVVVVGLAALVLLALGSRRERRGGLIALVVGIGVLLLAGAAALLGKDYVEERNLLPALVPLAAVVALGIGATRARLAGVLLAVALCVYWLAFDIYVTQTPNLQRLDYRGAVAALGPARVRRAIVSWRLAGGSAALVSRRRRPALGSAAANRCAKSMWSPSAGSPSATLTSRRCFVRRGQCG